MAATIHDVARRAGVGVGTVSRVLNNSGKVDTVTRQRVLQAVTELNYVPHHAARGLSSGRTNTIAVLIPFLTRAAMVERLRGVEKFLVENNYDLIVYNIETPERRDQCIREVPRRGRVDGVLIISLPPRPSDVDDLAAADVPVVLLDVHQRSIKNLNRLVTQDVRGGEQMTEFLIGLGHRRIGFVGDPPTSPLNFTSSNDRLRGYRQVLKKARIPFRAEYVGQRGHGRAQAHASALEMLRLPKPPTAIFAASDTQAMGVLDAAGELDMRLPRDLSVVGYDDIEVAEHIGLTTMRQFLFESGQRGAQRLLQAIADASLAPRCEVLPTELIVRQSAAPPRRA